MDINKRRPNSQAHTDTHLSPFNLFFYLNFFLDLFDRYVINKVIDFVIIDYIELVSIVSNTNRFIVHPEHFHNAHHWEHFRKKHSKITGSVKNLFLRNYYFFKIQTILVGNKSFDDYSLQPFWVWCHKLGTPVRLCAVLPIPLSSSTKHDQVQWGALVHRHF